MVVTNFERFRGFVEVIGEENNDDDNLSPVGLEGLIHISELSWNKVAHPREWQSGRRIRGESVRSGK